MSDYRRRILEIYKEDIVNFIGKLNRKTGAKVQHNFQILWKNAYSEGYHVVPVVSFSQEKKTQVVIGEISFYLTDSYELSLSDYQITFFEDIQVYNPVDDAAGTARVRQPAFDDAVSDLAWLFKEVSRVLDTLDFTFLISGGETGFMGFPTASFPGFHPGNSQRRQNSSGAADRQKGYSQARKNISFQTAAGGGSGGVTVSHTATFHYAKNPSGNEFYDAAPPWFDDLRDYSPPAAEKIKTAFQKIQQQHPLDTPLSKIWELLTEALYQQGYLEHACQQKQSGFRLNQYGECTYYSCPVRRRMGEHDGRCHYQTLDFKT